jgi:hypothetical protein
MLSLPAERFEVTISGFYVSSRSVRQGVDRGTGKPMKERIRLVQGSTGGETFGTIPAERKAHPAVSLLASTGPWA